jgi:hypothetical protein
LVANQKVIYYKKKMVARDDDPEWQRKTIKVPVVYLNTAMDYSAWQLALRQLLQAIT